LNEFRIPAIDISPYVEASYPVGSGQAERGAVADEWDLACREVGFVQIHGHGVPADVIDGLAAAIDAFFGLELSLKKAYIRPPGQNRGYTAPKSESLSLSLGVESANRMNDFFEAFNVGNEHSAFPGLALPHDEYAENSWPELADFRPAVERYFAAADRVARVLSSICADALGLPTDFFEAFTDHPLDTLRMNNYALPAGLDVKFTEDLTGMGEHTDYGILTVLWADRVAGLQVLGADQHWHDVEPEPGALLVNLGDLIAIWTNDRWRSTLHRVKPPLVDGSIRRRRSAAYFHDGNIDAVIDTFPSCRDADGGSAYGSITIGHHIRAKLAGSRAGVANAPGRETERVLSAQQG
jgi:isopenicillin N synthase-like dioxygenase